MSAAQGLMGGAGGMQALGAITQGFSKAQSYGAEQNADNANAAYDIGTGKSAFMASANKGATGLRQGAEAVGEQAAAIGQSGTGISSASNQSTIRQSETDTRLDYLNTIYGGQIQKYGYDVQAQQQQYMAKIAGLNKQSAITGGFLSAGSDALSSAAQIAMM